VLRLVATSVQDGRKVKPWLSIGICGEHGGEPTSIGLFDQADLSYVSASPLRVPVARLAAAQSHIRLSKVKPAAIEPIAEIRVRSELRKLSIAGVPQVGAAVVGVVANKCGAVSKQRS